MDKPTPSGLPRVVHVKDKVPGAVYVGRKNGAYGLTESPISNPYPLTRFSRPQAIELYTAWLITAIRRKRRYQIEALIACRTAPALACWCRHDGQPPSAANACHADVILTVLAGATDEQLRNGKVGE